MDVELQQAKSQMRLALMALQHRQRRLDGSVTKMSRHYNKLKHTAAMIGLLEELLGIVFQDPDSWDDEPDLVPF